MASVTPKTEQKVKEIEEKNRKLEEAKTRGKSGKSLKKAFQGRKIAQTEPRNDPIPVQHDRCAIRIVSNGNPAPEKP